MLYYLARMGRLPHHLHHPVLLLAVPTTILESVRNQSSSPAILYLSFLVSGKFEYKSSQTLADLCDSIPLLGAAIAFFYLHRRHVRKQRQEDARDPHKSMDFGLGDGPRKGRKDIVDRANANIGLEEKSGRSARQRSLDLDINSPYLLPPELQNSRESLHSLSRTIHQQEDPYRPVSEFIANDAASIRSYNRPRGDGASVYTNSSGRTPSRLQENATSDLLRNAAGMPRSTPATGFVPPPRQNSLPKTTSPLNSVYSQNHATPQLSRAPDSNGTANLPQIQIPSPTVANPQRRAMPNGPPSNPRPLSYQSFTSGSPNDNARESYPGNDNAALRASNNYLGAFINANESSPPALTPPPPAKSPEHWPVHLQEPEPVRPGTSGSARPETPSKSGLTLNYQPRLVAPGLFDVGGQQSPRKAGFTPPPQGPTSPLPVPPQQQQQKQPAPQPQSGWFDDGGSDYGEGFEITPPSPREEKEIMRSQRYSMDVPPEEFAQAGLGAPGFDPRRISIGFRPLPPNLAVESDDPEVRANRIRSFYKEYFDDSKPAPQGQYFEDYDQNYLGDGAYYDPNQNNFVMPYAQPVTRRAMTPPPQSQRFMGAPPRALHGSMGGSMRGFPGGPMMPPGPRAGSSASNRMPPPRGRAQSNASSRMGPPGPRSQSSASNRMGPPGPRKQVPPPAALNTLPTPSKLRDDSFALMGSIDFAPPASYSERNRGRSQSPLGERRPYSPAVPAYKPLASSYDELPSIPSP
jgi:hypothetical protein